ncbi:MAG TPA: replicative DNA helicase [Acidothermaceae bacterium]|nr:replicative DNA helicase [Acidothermaceae bacterium]
MSVIELPGQARDAERTPPQDINAEQSVLGGMLLSKDAIADVVEALHGQDFYRPAHQTVFDVILDLYGRGEPADAITVAAELTKRGEIARVGGAAYLHTLMSSVPTAANAGYYAKIVAEKAILRRLVEAGTRIVQLGYAGNGGDVDEIVDRAQAAIYDVTERRTNDDYSILESLLQPTMDEIEASGQRGAGLTGVPTGFNDLDALTNGLHPGQLVVIAGRPAMGKALALDTPLPTPSGWTTMGAINVGDVLLGADGRPTRVVAATEVMVDRSCFEVEFDDGSVIVADGQHQWATVTRASRRAAQESFARTGARTEPTASIHTTVQLAATLRCNTADRRLNHTVANAAPLDLPEAPLPLPPYALGVWLGDGHSASARYTSDDPEIAMHIEDDGLDVVSKSRRLFSLRLRQSPAQVPTRECLVCGEQDGSVAALLRAMGVLQNKHIPTQFLRASAHQRRQLLAGLLDTDGTVSRTGAVQITLTNQRLALDVRELVVSLGYHCGWQEKPVAGRTVASSIGYVITFSPADNPFRLERKRLMFKERAHVRTPRVKSRFIVDVRPVNSVPVRCVEVDNESHLYLAGRSMIPTHNSTLGLDIARAASIKHHQTSVIFSLEMSKHEITMRLLSAEARIPLQYMRTGRMGDDDWVKLTRRLGEMASAPLYIDDSPNLTMMEIRAKARRLKQRNDLRLVIVDYLQLMTSHSRVENRQQEVSQISRSMKLLAKELEVPVIALSQLNRGPEQRTDKKPQLSDLRESGAIEQDADVVILLHREDAYERESPRAGEADLIVAKHRNGPTDTLVVAFQGHYSRFVDMAPA